MNENIDIKTERYVTFEVDRFNLFVDTSLPTILSLHKTKKSGIPAVCNIIKIEMSKNHIATLRGANSGWSYITEKEYSKKHYKPDPLGYQLQLLKWNFELILENVTISL